MAKTEQEIGEAQVRDLFIGPVGRLGLARPKGTKVADFEGMKRELCARLWRMEADALADLADWVVQHPEAIQNHWPPAAVILREARKRLPPPWPPSDRMVAIFNHEIGRAALKGGWAPELFREFVGSTAFPNDYSAGQVFNGASGNVKRMAGLDRDLAAGVTLSEDDAQWRSRRLRVIDHCKKIRDYKAEAKPGNAAIGGGA